MDDVPYPQPLAGPEPQYVPWGVLLVRPIGHPPRPVPPRTADQRSRAYPTLLRVLRWGRYGHQGGPQTPDVGSPACVSRGPFSSRPPFRCCGLRWWVSRLSRVGWWWRGGAFRFSCRVACVRVPTSPGCGSPPVCGFVAWFVRAWCLCWCVYHAFVVAWVWVCLPCVLICVCVCVWVCGWGRLGLAAGVGVGVVGLCRGRSLATPGGCS